MRYNIHYRYNKKDERRRNSECLSIDIITSAFRWNNHVVVKEERDEKSRSMSKSFE